jgi:tRNA (Thr-GGU) A37 N-methylase
MIHVSFLFKPNVFTFLGVECSEGWKGGPVGVVNNLAEDSSSVLRQAVSIRGFGKVSVVKPLFDVEAVDDLPRASILLIIIWLG